MTSKEIFEAIRSDRRSQDNVAIRMAVSCHLYRKGYKTSHISNAIGMSENSVKYYVSTARALRESVDEMMAKIANEVSTHIIELVPYYERNGQVLRIRNYLIIDNNRM